jgi:pimeloyl-ACP methyl ester carboxylesterase
MATLRINGADLSYQIAGAGARVFLLFNEGTSGGLWAWGEVFDGLAALGRVVAFEWPALDRQLRTDTMTLEHFSDDARALLDHLGVASAVLIGLAHGGRVAQVFARDYPVRTVALVILGTGGHFPPLPSALGREFWTKRALDRDTWERAYLADMFSPTFARERPDRARRALDAGWRHRTPRTADTWALLLEAAKRSPSHTYWGTAVCPALLLYGADDKYGHPQHGRDLQQRLLGARLVVLEGVGHFPTLEAPERVLAEITAFVGSLPA